MMSMKFLCLSVAVVALATVSAIELRYQSQAVDVTCDNVLDLVGDENNFKAAAKGGQGNDRYTRERGSKQQGNAEGVCKLFSTLKSSGSDKKSGEMKMNTICGAKSANEMAKMLAKATDKATKFFKAACPASDSGDSVAPQSSAADDGNDDSTGPKPTNGPKGAKMPSGDDSGSTDGNDDQTNKTDEFGCDSLNNSQDCGGKVKRCMSRQVQVDMCKKKGCKVVKDSDKFEAGLQQFGVCSDKEASAPSNKLKSTPNAPASKGGDEESQDSQSDDSGEKKEDDSSAHQYTWDRRAKRCRDMTTGRFARSDLCPGHGKAGPVPDSEGDSGDIGNTPKSTPGDDSGSNDGNDDQTNKTDEFGCDSLNNSQDCGGKVERCMSRQVQVDMCKKKGCKVVKDSDKFEAGLQQFGVCSDKEASAPSNKLKSTPNAPASKGGDEESQDSQSDVCAAVSRAERKECGHYGIKEGECSAKGCCWKPLEHNSKEPWCFHKPATSGEAGGEGAGSDIEAAKVVGQSESGDDSAAQTEEASSAGSDKKKAEFGCDSLNNSSKCGGKVKRCMSRQVQVDMCKKKGCKVVKDSDKFEAGLQQFGVCTDKSDA